MSGASTAGQPNPDMPGDGSSRPTPGPGESGAPAPVRRRILAGLFAGSALARTGFIAAITVASLAAEDMLGSATLGGVPAAATTVGVALGTAPTAWFMARKGRRPAIAAGLVLAAAGAAVSAGAVVSGRFPLLVVGMALFGLGSAADRLARYAAADVSPPARRAYAISIVVWAGTIGSVAGPALLPVVERLAESAGRPGLVGPYVLAAGAAVAAAGVALAALRPDPLDFAPSAGTTASDARLDVADVLARPPARLALTALAIGQVTMVLIMTMTPVYLRRGGGDLGEVGIVIAAHTLGMFAFSPLTGLLGDRFGRRVVIGAGAGLLLAAGAMAAFAGGDDVGLLVGALFVLGLGWNFGFVAGSALLTESVPVPRRVAVQGFGDTVVWSSGALASFSSGFVLEGAGYAGLCWIGAALVLAPLTVLARTQPTVRR